MPDLRVRFRRNYNLNLLQVGFQIGKQRIFDCSKQAKAYIKRKKMTTSSDAIEAIRDNVYCILDSAITRIQANRRSTVNKQDL